MATTWMKALHRSGGIAAAIGRSTDYIENPDKTNGGELIDTYECDPFTAQSEFLFSKRLYAQKTGRDQGEHDVIAYHVRMSFKPGEVTAEQALSLGRELAIRWTRGKHQFIVAAHTNTNNPHTHIIFNSVNLDCDEKYSDFKRSAIALRRVSDQICLEHGLSIIEKPGLSKGYNRAEYLGGNKVPSARERLRELIDASLRKGDSLDGFLAAMKDAGCEVKRGKHLAFKMPGGKRFLRCDSLGEDYIENALLERISGKRIVKEKEPAPCATLGAASRCPNLLIDIQEKIQQGKGEGYRHWAANFNLKEMSKTLIFLQENGLTDYAQLEQRTVAASENFHRLSNQIKSVERRMKEIAELQKHISNYRRTREVYKQYREAGYSKKFKSQHEADIIIHQAAKKYFDAQGVKKLPPFQQLKQEYATMANQKKKLYSQYRQAREEMKNLLIVKNNTDQILGRSPQQRGQDFQR